MPSYINRGSNPQEYYDITSPILLKTPEPQYPYAALAKSALALELVSSDTLALTPAHALTFAGANYSNIQEGRANLCDPLYKEAIFTVADLGKPPGHTIRFNKPRFLDTKYELADRRLPQNGTISLTPMSVGSDQVSITIDEFGGPYDPAQNAVAPFGLQRLDSAVSLHNLASFVDLHMRRDFDKFLDYTFVKLFDTASNIIWSNGMTSDDDATSPTHALMDWPSILSAVERLRTTHVDTFPNGHYILSMDSHQYTSLQMDASIVNQIKYYKELNPILAPYYRGSLGLVDIFECNTLTVKTNANGYKIHYAQVFGPSMVGFGVSGVPKVAVSSQTDYGRKAFPIWMMMAGFSVFDSRFGVSLRTT